jgi:hypothetical protein
MAPNYTNLLCTYVFSEICTPLNKRCMMCNPSLKTFLKIVFLLCLVVLLFRSVDVIYNEWELHEYR